EVPALFLNTLFLVMGLFSKFTGLSNIATYWLFYIIFMFGFFLSLYYFITYFFNAPRKKKATFVIALTSSGFGFIFWIAFKAFDYTPLFFSNRLPLGSRIFPIDLWLTDAITFLTLYSSYIQQVAGVIAMLLIFTYFLMGWKIRAFKYILYSGALTFLLGTFHLYDVVTVYAVLTVFAIITLLRERDSQRLKMYAGYIAVSMPPMLFNFYAFALHPIFKEFTAYNVQLSPNPYSYLLGFGLPLLLSAYYVYKVRLDDKKLLLAVWVGISLALAYFPLTVQRKLQLGLNIPLAILAAYAIFEFVLPKFKEHQRNLVLVALILLMMPTNLLWIAKETYKVNAHGYPGTDYPYYTHNLDLEAIQWLGVNAGKEDIILSGGVTGGRIAGMVSKKVYWGGNDMTLQYQEKMRLVEEFFSDMSDREREELLDQNGISLVYYGVEEGFLGNFNPDDVGYLRKVFDNWRVKIYRVESKNMKSK
ncbi:MAG: hypothetical protein QF673_04515, partial [Candidatus Hydrothermarchaeota archaeon]|nr:hypothetical protein [Candidatus Hydrothermarchaeota archaeon]